MDGLEMVEIAAKHAVSENKLVRKQNPLVPVMTKEQWMRTVVNTRAPGGASELS
jgi:hypothetical protein